MAEKEVSMSIDETNRLRASLGLKPLSDKPAAAEQAAAAAPKKAPEGPSKEELLARVTESREKRRREAELRSTKTLGASGDDVDDLAAWAARVKPQSAADAAGLNPAAADGAVAGAAGGSSRPSKRQKRGGGKAAAAADGEEEDGDEGGDGHTAADLAGVKVRHDLENLTEGEAVVLTLADTGILDERGELADGPDTLENALVAEQAARSKARGAATKKAKPLWEEDGKVRGLLDKYDEEEEDAMAAFDAGGALALSERQRQRQAELSSKLAAGAAALLGGDGGVLGGGGAAGGGGGGGGGDYMTADEAAAAKGGGGGEKKKKKKSRKLRTTKVAEEEEDGGGAGGGLDLDALEAAAAAEAAAAGGGDLGSRSAREQRRREQEEAKAAAAAERTARFEAALSKANVASEQLRPSVAAAAAAAAAGEGGMGGGLFDDDADDELAASLARARRVAQKGTDAAAAGEGGAAVGEGGAGAATANGRGGGGGITSSSSSLAGIARELAIKREQEEEELKRQIASGGAEAFSETAEFVRSIQPLGPKAEDAAGATYMDVDEQQQPAAAAAAGDASVAAAAAGGGGDVDMLPPPPADSKPPLPPKQQRKYRKGGWVSAEGDEANGDADGAGGSSRGRQRPAPELEDTGVVGERAMGKGLAATLGLIKDKGMLRDTTMWAGRNNDKKPVALIGLEDVYTGGAHEDAMQQRIETALTQRDEFGRVMTPKERFRVMCHQFHGKPPSKNKQEQRQRKYLEEVAVARATSSENPSAELDKMKELQRQTGSAYIPLTGKFKPSSNTAAFGAADDDQPSGFASARTATAATPMLGGGLTPLSGNKKVEMMLGISKAGAGGGGDGAGSMAPPAPRR